jgi:hypothetical protein
MSDTLDELREEYPQYRLVIDKMARQNKSFEEIESHLIDLNEMNDD